MKFVFAILLLVSGLASAISGPAPTQAPAKRQFGLDLFNGGNQADIQKLAEQLGINLGGNITNVSNSQLNCDIVQLLALMGLDSAVDVSGLNLGLNQQINMILALEQLAGLQSAGLVSQNDILSLLAAGFAGNANNVSNGLDLSGLFSGGLFARNLNKFKQERSLPEHVPTPASVLRVRGHGRKRQEACTINLGTATSTTTIETATAESTTTETAAEATATAESTTTEEAASATATEEATATATGEATATATEKAAKESKAGKAGAEGR